MENLITLFYLAGAVLSVILIISWFNTVKNVKEIKETLKDVNSLSLIEKAKMAEFMNDKETALSYYMQALYNESKHLVDFDEYTLNHTEKSLKKRYLSLIERNNGKWPDFKLLTNPD